MFDCECHRELWIIRIAYDLMSMHFKFKFSSQKKNDILNVNKKLNSFCCSCWSNWETPKKWEIFPVEYWFSSPKLNTTELGCLLENDCIKSLQTTTVRNDDWFLYWSLYELRSQVWFKWECNKPVSQWRWTAESLWNYKKLILVIN